MSKDKGGFANMLHGLDDLSDLNLPAKPASSYDNEKENSAGSMLAIKRIKRDPNQPRRKFDRDKIRELADSIKQRGQLQPISVRPDPGTPGEYIINWGERRWLAMQELNLDQIRAEVQEHADLELAQLAENLDREDLTHMEIAYAVEKLIKEKGYKPGAIAAKMARSDAWISNYLQLPRMPDFLRESLEAKTINDVFTAVEAFRLFKEHPDRVTETVVAATAESPVDRTTIRELKAKLKGEDNRAKGGKATPPPADPGTESTGKPPAPPAPDKPAALSITVHVEDQDGVELGTLTLSPDAPADRAKVVGLDGKGEMELPWREVRIRKITYH